MEFLGILGIACAKVMRFIGPVGEEAGESW